MGRIAVASIFTVSVLVLLPGCRESSREEAKEESTERTTVDLPNTPTEVPPERIRPLEPPDPLPPLIATIQSRAGKVALDDDGVAAIDWHGAPIHNLDLELLTEVPELKRLYLPGVKVDSRGFQYLAALPNLQRLALWRTPIRDEDLEFLANAKKLKILDLSRTAITGVGLAHLANCENLETLILRNSTLDKFGIAHVAKIHSLRMLDLRGTAINQGSEIAPLRALPNLEEVQLTFGDAEVLRQLAGFPNIRRLVLTRFPRQLATALVELSRMQRLERIEYANRGNQDDFLKHVSKCPNLREIRVHRFGRFRAEFTEAGLSHLEGQESLRLLDFREASPALAGTQKIAEANPHVKILVSPIRLHGLHDAFRSMGIGARHSRDGGPRLRLDREMNITAIRLEDARAVPQSLKPIGEAIDPEKLEHLGLGNTKLTDEGLAEFPAGGNLRHLNLWWTKITADGLKTWGGGQYPELPLLETIDLRETKLDDDCLRWIGTHGRLKTLRLGAVQGVTDPGWAAIANLTQLEELDCSRTNWNDETMSAIDDLPKLRVLKLSSNRIGREGLMHLEGSRELQSLDLSGIAIQPADLKPLTKLPGLEHLSISTCPLGDEVFPVLANCRSLRSLNLRGAKIQRGKLAMLAGLEQLAELNLSANDLTPDAFGQLSKLKQIRRLELDLTPTTDELLLELGELEQIESLSLSSTKITDLGLSVLASLPQLQSLDLSFSPITGEGFDVLSKLPALQFLNLTGTKVPPHMIEALGRVRPELQIEW